MNKLKMALLIGFGVLMANSTFAQTSAPNNAYGDNQVEVEPGVFAIYSGDMNQDGYIDPFDYAILEADNLSFATGYVVSDLNGDGYVDPFDYSIFELNNLNFVSSIRP